MNRESVCGEVVRIERITRDYQEIRKKNILPERGNEEKKKKNRPAKKE